MTEAENLAVMVMKLNLTNLSTLAPFLISMGTLVPRRRPRRYFVLYYFVKCFVGVTCMDTILRHFYGQEMWWQALYFFIGILFIFTNCVVLRFIYDGSFLKIMLASVISEVIALISSNTAMVTIHILCGPDDLSSVWERTGPAYFFMPFLSYLIFSVLYLFGKQILIKYRKYQIRHPVLWGAFFGVYVVVSLAAMIPDPAVQDIPASGKMLIFLQPALLGMACLIVGWVALRRYRKKVEEEHSYLLRLKKMMEAQYILLKEQVGKIEYNRKKIDEKMKELEELKDAGEYQGRIKNYLSTLEEEYFSVAAGIYSQDCIVDSIFVYAAGICRANQIRADFSAQKYRGGQEGKMRIEPFLMEMLEWAIQENLELPPEKRFLRLHVATVKNQVVAELEYGCRRKRRKADLILQKRAEELGGSLQWEWARQKKKIVAVIEE